MTPPLKNPGYAPALPIDVMKIKPFSSFQSPKILSKILSSEFCLKIREGGPSLDPPLS